MNDKLASDGVSVRLHNVDRLRILAIVAVVAFHRGDCTKAFRALQIGIPAFLVIGCMFRARRPFTPRRPRAIASRARRLLVPWLFWNLVYAAPGLGRVVIDGAPVGSEFSWEMLFTGSAIHLWFLPYLFFVEIVTSALARAAEHVPLIPRLLGLIALAVVLLAFLHIHGGHWYVTSWCFGLAAVPVGLAFREALDRRPVRLLRVVAGLLLALVVASVISGVGHNSVRYMTASGLLAAALSLRGRAAPITARLTACILGVYLLHPLVIHLLPSMQSWPSPLGLLVVVLVSFAVTDVLRRTPLRHVL